MSREFYSMSIDAIVSRDAYTVPGTDQERATNRIDQQAITLLKNPLRVAARQPKDPWQDIHRVHRWCMRDGRAEDQFDERRGDEVSVILGARRIHRSSRGEGLHDDGSRTELCAVPLPKRTFQIASG